MTAVATPPRLSDVLEEIAELVSRGRCVGAAARDLDGNMVSVASPKACTFCAMGAAMRVTKRMEDGNSLYALAFERMDDYARAQRATGLAVWNDVTPHDTVVAAIRRLALDERVMERERAGGDWYGE